MVERKQARSGLLSVSSCSGNGPVFDALNLCSKSTTKIRHFLDLRKQIGNYFHTKMKVFSGRVASACATGYIAILHIALRNLVCEVERRVIYSINYYK